MCASAKHSLMMTRRGFRHHLLSSNHHHHQLETKSGKPEPGNLPAFAQIFSTHSITDQFGRDLTTTAERYFRETSLLGRDRAPPKPRSSSRDSAVRANDRHRRRRLGCVCEASLSHRTSASCPWLLSPVLDLLCLV